MWGVLRGLPDAGVGCTPIDAGAVVRTAVKQQAPVTRRQTSHRSAATLVDHTTTRTRSTH